MTVFH